MKNALAIALAALISCSIAGAQDATPRQPSEGPVQPAQSHPKAARGESDWRVVTVPRSKVALIVEAMQDYVGPYAKVWSSQEVVLDASGKVTHADSIVLRGDANANVEWCPKLVKLATEMCTEKDPAKLAIAELIDFDFPGGTCAEFLAALYPKSIPLNIVYSTKECSSVVMPALTVRGVNRNAVLELMRRVQTARSDADPSCWFEWLTESSRNASGMTVPIVGDRPTLIVNFQSPRNANPFQGINGAEAERQPTVIRILPADAVSAQARAEQERAQKDIMLAIDDGLATRGGASKSFKLKLNSATGIMFVQGTGAERQLVTDIVEAIMPRTRPSTADAARATSADPLAPK